MLELPNNEQSPLDDDGPLFLERFKAFMEKTLTDIQAFAEREARPLQEISKLVAQWHCNYLFQCRPLSSQSDGNSNRRFEIWNLLADVSRVLESLCDVFGVESFLLAVDSEESSAEGFLGGSQKGREFWRGLRSGGDAGARTFQRYCIKDKDTHDPQDVHMAGTVNAPSVSTSAPASSSSSSPKPSAKNVKFDLYDSVRKALRSVSGIRNAEMKWTNHDRLFSYGVYLVGWPPDIPFKNPSALKVSQNKRLLELLKNGSMKFVKNVLLPFEPANLVSEEDEVVEEDQVDEQSETFSWAIQFDEDSSPPESMDPSATVPEPVPSQSVPIPTLAPRNLGRSRKRARFGGEILRFGSADDAIT